MITEDELAVAIRAIVDELWRGDIAVAEAIRDIRAAFKTYDAQGPARDQEPA